ncbi:hypothetical protein L1987_70604 [Smallanthus sonchifolius]|uniref:Uncharacterized protein n=1 Tax=Smallanthus sonchifolius TaxID=185202 RepID=A0ACB9AQ61_9ASTR|nr:hypothetical protein L1987_70604 [Smallanthus sonchifolius]
MCSASINTVRRNRSTNGGERACRNGMASPATEPPSPRVPVCGLCRAFRKTNKNHSRFFRCLNHDERRLKNNEKLSPDV